MGACATKLKGAVKADDGDAPIPMKDDVSATLSKDISVPEQTKVEVLVAPPTKDEVVAAPEKDELVVSEKSLEIDGSGEQDIEKRRSLNLLFKEDLPSVPNKDAKPEEILVTEKTIEQCEIKTTEIEVENKSETPAVSEIEKSEIKTPEIEMEKKSETVIVSEIKKSEIVEEAPKTVQVTEITPVLEAKPEEPIETVEVVTEQCETKTPEIKVEQKPETVVEPAIEKHEIVTEQVPVVYVEAPKEPVVAETPPVTLTDVKPEEPSKIEKITEPSETKTPEIKVENKAEIPVKSEIEKFETASPAPKTEELAIAPPAPEIKKPEISEEKKESAAV